MSSQRREQARASCDAELVALRAREKTASAEERAKIVGRKAELKQMRKVGVHYDSPRSALAGMSLPWGKTDDWDDSSDGSKRVGGFTLPQMPKMPDHFPTTADFPFQLPMALDAELMAGTASFGTLSGFCSGLALKKIGRAAATVAGVIFMSLTAAERSGYIEVKWTKVRGARKLLRPLHAATDQPFAPPSLQVKEATIGALDTTGDGELTQEDARKFFGKLVEYMTQKNAALSAGSYATGLVLGWRWG